MVNSKLVLPENINISFWYRIKSINQTLEFGNENATDAALYTRSIPRINVYSSMSASAMFDLVPEKIMKVEICLLKLFLKGALDKYNIILQLFPKNCYNIRSVGMSNDCILSFTF